MACGPGELGLDLYRSFEDLVGEKNALVGEGSASPYLGLLLVI